MPTDQEAADLRAELEAAYGQVYATDELREAFEVLSFAFCMAIVRRRSDGVKGVLQFNHMPRLYYDFVPTIN